jgi:hypothetical protein
VGKQRFDVAESSIDPICHSVGQPECRAAIRHVRDVDTGLFAEQHDGQMRYRPGSCRAEIQLAWVCLGIGHKIARCVEAELAA